LTVAMIVCGRGVAAAGPVAEKLRLVGETENCGGGALPPPPPPPQAAMILAMSVAQHASATVRIRDIFLGPP
jgi:hypothetical protein